MINKHKDHKQRKGRILRTITKILIICSGIKYFSLSLLDSDSLHFRIIEELSFFGGGCVKNETKKVGVWCF